MDTVTKTPRIGRHSPRISNDGSSGSEGGSRRGSEQTAGLGVTMKDDVPRRMFQGMPETPSPPRHHTRRSSTSLGYLGSPLGGGTSRFVDAPSPTSRKGSISQETGSNSDTFGRARLLPPTTPKSRTNEVFMSPSPKLKSPHVSKDVEKKPIKEISIELKTRLNYALMKLQNGWVDKTLPELEHALTTTTTAHEKENVMMYDLHHNNRDHHRAVFDQMNMMMSPGRKGRTSTTYVNQFANDNSETFFSINRGKRRSPRGSNVAVDDNSSMRAGSRATIKHEEDDDNTQLHSTNEVKMEDGSDKDDEMNSAHSAFLKALSSPKKRLSTTTSPQGLPVSPLRWTNNKPKPLKLDTSTKHNSDPEDKDKPDTSGPPSEVEAIETLMSLASPKKSAGTLDDALSSKPSGATPTHLRNSTTKGQFTIDAKDHPEQQSDVETEIDEG